jgi:hypothetical protein
MNPFIDLNSTPEGQAIATQYAKDKYASKPDIRLAKNLRDKAWRRKTGRVPYTHTKSESEMIAEYLAKHQSKDITCNSQH